MKFRLGSTRKLIILLSFAFLQACAVNLPAVRDFSKNTVAASNSFNLVADDIPASCIRRVNVAYKFESVENIEKNGEKVVKFNQKYLGDLENCRKIKESLDGVVAANDVLKNYAEALGKLASDDVATFTAELNSLEGSLKKVDINGNKPFDNQRVAAISGIAKFLFNAAANGYRQKKLKETIEVGNNDLPGLIDGLEDVVELYKSQLLKREKTQIEFEQVELERIYRNNNGILNERLYETLLDLQIIENKMQAAEDFKSILDNISRTHNQLYESSNELNSKALILLIQNYVKQLQPLINNLREAFAS